MKKKLALAIAIIVVLSVVFFPMTTTHSISGDGDILTPQKEKIGTCELEIKLKKFRLCCSATKRVSPLPLMTISLKSLKQHPIPKPIKSA